MPEDIKENETPKNEGEEQPKEAQEDNKELQSALAQKQHWRDKAEKLEEENTTLKEVSEDEKVEPSTWKEAGDYATERAYKKIQGEMQEKEEADTKMAGEFKTQIEAIRGLGHKISKDDEVAILEQMVENNQDLLTATNEFVSERTKTEKATQQKEEGFIPPTGGGSDSGVGRLSYKELKNTSMSTLIQRAANAQKK